MKALIYPGRGEPLVLETRPDPVPGPDDLVIRVHRCGICGTDLHMTSGHTFDFPPGTAPGHEFAGEIVEIGTRVAGFRKGERVTALPSIGCGACAACAHGNFVLCRRKAEAGMGGFAEYVRVPARVAVRLPTSLSLADGALVEPLAVGLYALRQSRMAPGARMLILGAGSVALCAIYWARRLGAGRIVAASRSARRADMARAMGADAFVLYGDNEAADASMALGGTPDVVFECVGEPGFLGKAVALVKPFGEVVSMGFCTSPDPLVPALAAMKAAILKFPVGYTLAEFEDAAHDMDKGHIDPKQMITSTISLSEAPAMFAKLRAANAETKVHVAP